MALLNANACSVQRTLTDLHAKVSPALVRSMAMPCSRFSPRRHHKMPSSGLSATSNLCTGTISPSFASPFFADPSFQKVRRQIAEVKDQFSSSPHGGACTSTASAILSGETLRWIFAGASILLMLLKSAFMNKAFLVPLLALQAPNDIINWIRGDYGIWAAFLAVLVRLFYFIPGELELPLIFVLIVITAPYQIMDLRGTIGSIFLCSAVAAYLAYQHFSGAGGLKGSFKEGTFLASFAAICLVAVPCIFLFGSF